MRALAAGRLTWSPRLQFAQVIVVDHPCDLLEPRNVIFIAWSLYTLSLVKNDFTPLMS
jgi:hypothetical protein